MGTTALKQAQVTPASTALYNFRVNETGWWSLYISIGGDQNQVFAHVTRKGKQSLLIRFDRDFLIGASDYNPLLDTGTDAIFVMADGTVKSFAQVVIIGFELTIWVETGDHVTIVKEDGDLTSLTTFHYSMVGVGPMPPQRRICVQTPLLP